MANLLNLPVILSPFFTEILNVIAVITLSIIAARITSTVVKFLGQLASKTETTLDDELLEAVANPIESFFVLGGLYLALRSIDEIQPHFPWINSAAFTVAIMLAAWTVSRLVNTFISWYSKELSKRAKSTPLSFLKKPLAVFFFLAGLVVVLHSYGVEIGPIVTGLGIAGLAVALALQDTLQNFFAGIYLFVARPIKIGQTIQCSAGLGTVEEISGRNVRLRTWENQLIIIPNSKIVSDNITNFSEPEKTLLAINIGANYRNDPEKVEKLLMTIARKIMKAHSIPEDDGKPYVRFTSFGPSALEFSLRFYVPTYGDTFSIGHETRKEIWKAFRKAKIDIPFQTFTVNMKR